MILNKVDLADEATRQRFLELFHPSVAISAKTGEGLADLMSALGTELRPIREFVELVVPHEASDVIARLHQVAQVVDRDYEGEAARFKARIPPHLHAEFARYITEELQKA
jgi:GTP-binding protein HflX